jgi:hypothetical protein
MRVPFLRIPIAGLVFASLSAIAQEAPRVIFCTGQCIAVDEKGARTPAPKGTQLRPTQRLETGPGSYAQLKMGQDVAMAVGERAQVRFDSRSTPNRDIVFLDQGRIRVLDGETIGKATRRAFELRTSDGAFALRSADIEVRAPTPGSGSDTRVTAVKLNGGDARMVVPQGDIALTRGGVQGFAAGVLVTDRPVSIGDVALAPVRVGTVTTAPVAILTEPVRNLSIATIPTTTLTIAPTLLAPTTTFTATALSPTGSTTLLATQPIVSGGDKLTTTPVIDPVSSTTTTLTKLVTAPPTTTTTTTSTPLKTTTIILAPTTTTRTPTTTTLTVR